MFKEERCEKILELLHSQGFLTVEYLANKLHYSPATVRRDLVYLAKQGCIEKSYGGASAVDFDKRHILPYKLREKTYSDEKKSMCRLAADMISENNVIFIDGSTTAAGIIDFLDERKNITVITQNLESCIKLQQKNIKGFCTGGEILPQTPILLGKLTVDILSEINTDIMFFASKSISRDGIISEYSESIVTSLQAAMKNTSKIVYMTDSSKIGSKSMFNICSLDDVDAVISEKNIKDCFECDTDSTKFIF